MTRRTNRSQRAARVDYTEGETSSETETEGTVNREGVQREDCKLELDSNDTVSELDGSEKLWTPQTFATRTTQLSQQVTKLAKLNTDHDMARETEQTNLTAVMQMMMEVREADRKADIEREDRRIERERVERLERQQELRELREADIGRRNNY